LDITPNAGTSQSLELNSDAHIIIINNNNSQADVQGDSDEDSIVALAPNNNFAMGAPPSALGAIKTAMTLWPMDTAVRHVVGGTDMTPRAINVGLPRSGGGGDSNDPQDTPVHPNAVPHMLPLPVTTEIVPLPSLHHHHHHHHKLACPHRD
jgi:hypothetical protein